MDYAALKAELSLPSYSGVADSDIVAALNAATIDTTVDVLIGDLEGYLRLQGLVSALAAYGQTAVTGDAATAARELVGMIDSPHMSTIETSQPDTLAKITAFAAALVTAAQLSQPQSDDMLALAAAKTSRAQQLLGASVNIGDLQTARAQP